MQPKVITELEKLSTRSKIENKKNIFPIGFDIEDSNSTRKVLNESIFSFNVSIFLSKKF